MITGQGVGISARVAQSSQRSHRWYYSSVGMTAILIAIAGFAPSLLNSSARLGPISPLVSVHGLLFMAWLVLFVVQSWLVATRRVAVHRRLGFAAIGVAVLMLVTGYATVIEQTRRGYDLSGDLNIQSDPKFAAVFPLGDLVSFAVFVAAGLWHRRKAEVHKRLMTLATIGGLMPAALAHFVGHNLGLPNLDSVSVVLVPMLFAAVFLAPAVYDRIRLGRFHPITLWCGVSLFVWGNFRTAVIGPSRAWHNLMTWLAG